MCVVEMGIAECRRHLGMAQQPADDRNRLGPFVNLRAKGALAHFPRSGPRRTTMRQSLSKFGLALPYIWRFTALKRLIWPST